MSRLRFKTPRLMLREFTRADRAEWTRVHEVSEEFFAPWMPSRPDGLTHAQRFDVDYPKWAADAENDRHYRLGGFDAGGRLVVLIGLNNIARGVFQNTDMGWRVSADRARQGFGKEGVIGALTLAFAPQPIGLGLHRVQANIIPANSPSVALALAVGFRKEGTARRLLQIAGVWQDHEMYAITADEFHPAFGMP